MRRSGVVVAVLTLVMTATAAFAYWSADTAPGGRASAAAAAVNRGATPTVSVTGRDVTLTWGATVLSDGQPVTGYLIGRYDAAGQTLVAQTVLPGCDGTRTSLTCTESNLPDGRWRYTVTPLIGTNWRGLESPFSSIALTPADTTGPTGGSIDAVGLSGTDSRYSSSTTLNLAFTAGSDPSGINSSTSRLERSSAPLSDASCGAYGAAEAVATAPTSPFKDTVVDSRCYIYRYIVNDALGNQTTYASPAIRVDATTPNLSIFGTGSNFSYADGSDIYYRDDLAGSFSITANADDPESGIASYTFQPPAFIGQGWTVSGTGTSRTYSWPAGATASGAQLVTASNGTGATRGLFFNLIRDTVKPTGTISYPGGFLSATSSIKVTMTSSDSGAGVGTVRLERGFAPFTRTGTCTTSYTWAPISANAGATYTDNVPESGCYQYRTLVTDRVRNSTEVTSSTITQVLLFGPSASTEKATVYSSAKAFDGSLDSMWVSNGSNPGEGPIPSRPEVLTYNFGVNKSISEVSVVPRSNYGPRNYSVEGLVDGQWTLLKQVTQTAPGPQRILFTTTRVDAVRLVITASYDPNSPNAPRNVQIAEFTFQ